MCTEQKGGNLQQGLGPQIMIRYHDPFHESQVLFPQSCRLLPARLFVPVVCSETFAVCATRAGSRSHSKDSCLPAQAHSLMTHAYCRVAGLAWICCSLTADVCVLAPAIFSMVILCVYVCCRCGARSTPTRPTSRIISSPPRYLCLQAQSLCS